MILYAGLAQSRHAGLDAETAFTTIAILSMVIHPANMIMTIVPRLVATFASFERVQSYLLEDPHLDQRKAFPDRSSSQLHHGPSAAAINLRQVTIQADGASEPALDNVTLEIKQSQIAACAGPTGAGKSLLAKTMLGEVYPRHGTVTIASRRIGYCDQTPWLPNGSMRDVICNFADRVDESQYEEAITSSCLVHDLSQLSMGDKTEIGSRGLNLSGGQRQRMVWLVQFCTCDRLCLQWFRLQHTLRTAPKIPVIATTTTTTDCYSGHCPHAVCWVRYSSPR